MRIIKPLVAVETNIPTKDWAQKLEYFTRKCYKSEGKMGPDTYDSFIRRVFRTMKHEGIIEHFSVSVTMVTDRGTSQSHERHRLASYLQESTRYCDYGKKGLTFILPPWIGPTHNKWSVFLSACFNAESIYNAFREIDWKPEQARYFLPLGIKTEYVGTHNLGSWYNFFKKRTAVQAHPMIRQLGVPLLRHFQERLPMIFDGLELPTLPYEEARLIEHYGVDPLDDYFEEAYPG